MDRHTDADGDEEESNLKRARNEVQLHQGERHDGATDDGVDDVIESELPGRDSELSVDRQQQHEVEFARADELGQVCEVHVKESLKKLSDELVGAEERD